MASVFYFVRAGRHHCHFGKQENDEKVREKTRENVRKYVREMRKREEKVKREREEERIFSVMRAVTED